MTIKSKSTIAAMKLALAQYDAIVGVNFDNLYDTGGRGNPKLYVFTAGNPPSVDLYLEADLKADDLEAVMTAAKAQGYGTLKKSEKPELVQAIVVVFPTPQTISGKTSDAFICHKAATVRWEPIIYTPAATDVTEND